MTGASESLELLDECKSVIVQVRETSVGQRVKSYSPSNLHVKYWSSAMEICLGSLLIMNIATFTHRALAFIHTLHRNHEDSCCESKLR